MRACMGIYMYVYGYIVAYAMFFPTVSPQGGTAIIVL